MAAITPTTVDKLGSMVILRNASAQANTGQVDWLDIPVWANSMTVYLNVTALAGTTRTIDFKIHEADPVARNDSYKSDLHDWNGITQLTATGFVVVNIGPGITGTTDDDTATVYKVNGPISHKLLGFATTLDRTDADETYTYTLAVVFHK